jgi:hypothetical protein
VPMQSGQAILIDIKRSSTLSACGRDAQPAKH